MFRFDSETEPISFTLFSPDFNFATMIRIIYSSDVERELVKEIETFHRAICYGWPVGLRIIDFIKITTNEIIKIYAFWRNHFPLNFSQYICSVQNESFERDARKIISMERIIEAWKD